jgi:hypothetical protein
MQTPMRILLVRPGTLFSTMMPLRIRPEIPELREGEEAETVSREQEVMGGSRLRMLVVV